MLWLLLRHLVVFKSAEDLFRIDRLMNSTFRLTIKEDCLRLPLREIYLLAFDVSLNDDVGYKEIDKLDQSKLDMIRVRRQMIKFGRTELKHFDHNSRFKLAIVFFDRRGEIEIVIQPMEFSLDDGEMGLGSFEPRSNPIATNDLLAVVAPMLEADIPIKQEYNYAPRSQLFSWNHGKLPENRCKNRYGNLLPYDHTRVTLRKEPITTSSSSTTSSNGMTTDYMNANFIDGYKKVGRYIASQGPINATLDDFWRCVWQYHVQQIVMLTNLEESGKAKCDKYWPEKSQYYGMVKVTLQKTELFADYTIRYFQLKKDSDDPMIVHCSAGIGRTGAFIMIDSMLLMAENEKRIDIWAHFCRIRTQRINMVEKYAQYRFVYQVLLEALSHDPTDISCTNFGNYLKQSIRGGSSCSLHKQYEMCASLAWPIINSIVNLISSHVSIRFNLIDSIVYERFRLIADYARVILPNLNDYINAVYVNYWPNMINNRLILSDDMSIIMLNEEINTYTKVRTIVLKPSELIVKHVQLRIVPNHYIKPKASGFYPLIELKEKLDSSNLLNYNNSPIIVQCSDGATLSGLFCASDFIFERIKEEQQIDVFLAVQKIRANRPQFIINYVSKIYP
ncbi:hypothetical protein RDWZM_002565 [Blomia tropicalis]|uniref:Uncharacterized protein n=1 Tax=Blomia tropicalis TaxID=40697 RepID=A0A9Q0RRV2_BLOTA|nr:hypothetical protein RDWZM_002565 [Blomia tropicalis]